MAPREERVQLLRAELLQPVSVADLGRGQAAVEMHLAVVAILAELDADVAQRIELRPGLVELGGERFGSTEQIVDARRAAGGPAKDALRVGARSEQQHVL